MEALALHKAKRLTVEKISTYLSTMTMVEEGWLSKAEVSPITMFQSIWVTPVLGFISAGR